MKWKMGFVVGMLVLLASPHAFCEENYGPRDKVLFVSVPKAGTHLLWKAIEWITLREAAWIGLANQDRFNPASDLLTTKPIMGIHLFEEADLARKEHPGRYNKILMIRDPRDVMVSFMHHLIKSKIWFSCPEFDHEKFLSLSSDEQLRETLLFPDGCLSPQISFSYAAEWIRDPSVFVCRFEDLVGEKGGGSAEKQREVLRKLGERLCAPLSEEKLDAITESLFGGTWTFRKGQIGVWKEAFNEENKELFKRLMGRSVIDLGYEADNNW